jgi:hypothetical protein
MMETFMLSTPLIDRLKIPLLVFGIGGVVVFALWLLLFRRWEKEGMIAREEHEAARQKVMALPLQEASRQALKLLGDPEHFECVYSDASLGDIASQFAPSLRSLASQFSLIRTVGGSAEIHLRDPSVSRFHPDYWSLGRGDEDGFLEVAVKLGQETIYEIDWGFVDRSGTPPIDEYPSIYHWIVFTEGD